MYTVVCHFARAAAAAAAPLRDMGTTDTYLPTYARSNLAIGEDAGGLQGSRIR